ncbi:UNVERIFIED_CONTAM: hypothetical protein K2H54_065769 [Gekko kuhli]
MEIPSGAITTLTSLSTGLPRARRVLPTEQAAGAALEEAGPAQGAHDPVVVVSSPEGSPGEDREPDPAAVMQVVEERLRTVESGMVNIRRTLNRHSYHLGFIQRGMVRQRNMLQRAMRPRQHRAVRRRAQQLGRGVPEAASQDSPPARGEEAIRVARLDRC